MDKRSQTEDGIGGIACYNDRRNRARFGRWSFLFCIVASYVRCLLFDRCDGILAWGGGHSSTCDLTKNEVSTRRYGFLYMEKHNKQASGRRRHPAKQQGKPSAGGLEQPEHHHDYYRWRNGREKHSS